MNTETKSAVLRLMDLAMQLNAPDFHVWCDFHGHVNGLDLDIMPGGYEKDKDAIRRKLYLDMSDADGVQRLADFLIEVHDDYRSPDWPECDDCLGGGK